MRLLERNPKEHLGIDTLSFIYLESPPFGSILRKVRIYIFHKPSNPLLESHLGWIWVTWPVLNQFLWSVKYHVLSGCGKGNPPGQCGTCKTQCCCWAVSFSRSTCCPGEGECPHKILSVVRNGERKTSCRVDYWEYPLRHWAVVTIK